MDSRLRLRRLAPSLLPSDPRRRQRAIVLVNLVIVCGMLLFCELRWRGGCLTRTFLVTLLTVVNNTTPRRLDRKRMQFFMGDVLFVIQLMH